MCMVWIVSIWFPAIVGVVLGSYMRCPQVDSLPMKRKLDDMEECCTVVESEMCEDSVSEDDWTSSSSVSDASDSESEQWTRRRNLIKRKRSGGDITEAFQPRSGLLFKSRSALDQEELVDCNEELKGMQELLQMQIQVTARCLRLNPVEVLNSVFQFMNGS